MTHHGTHPSAAAATSARTDQTYIRTASGGKCWPLAPAPEDIRLEDIAHHLSQLCRFTGATREFYSVAQHSVLVSEHCGRASTVQAALYGLLHDAAEAYLADIARPVKHSEALAGYRAAEATLQRVIYRRFGLTAPEPRIVKLMDAWVLHAELRDLVRGADPRHSEIAALHPSIEPLPPKDARLRFLARFEALAPAEVW